MAIRYSIFILLFSLTSKFACAQLALTIEITQLKNNNGHVLLSLYDENQVEIKSLKASIENAKSSFQIGNLKPAKYGFKYFHDEDDNGQIKTNSIGIPIEGYGFSKNAIGMFGPPSFDKWVFELKNDQKVQCHPKY